MVSYIFQGSSTHEARDQRKILYIRQSELKYLSNFRKRNQTRLLFGVFWITRAYNKKVKWKKICLNIGEPSSKAKENI